jgi:hypothetical protein
MQQLTTMTLGDRVEATVELLQTVAILCQRSGCGHAATHLFRSGGISVFCECHAKEKVDLIGIDLPTPATKALHAGGFSGHSTVAE